ncbi:MAG: acyl-CoA dehydrogenase family protein, partial [Nocardiopsaceae bacterium]|nr:acyl-CoA dehydrogenase family protein [Nocardiopsaceae bacterium]
MSATVDLLYSDTERELRDALGSLLEDRAAPAAVLARTERPDTTDAELWHAVASDIGLAGLLVPEALGGAGASARELAAAAEELAAAVAPVPYLG